MKISNEYGSFFLKVFAIYMLISESKRIVMSFITVYLLLTSCKTPQQKLNNLLERYPALKAKDTIIVRDTITATVPGASGSASTPVLSSDSCDCNCTSDTVAIDNAQLHARAWIENDTLYLEAECDTVEIEVPFEVPVEVDKIIYRRPRDGLIWAVIFLVGVLCGLYVRIRKREAEAQSNSKNI